MEYMKLRKLTYKQELTFWIIFGGVNAIANIVNGKYLLAGCNIGVGLILIYISRYFIKIFIKNDKIVFLVLLIFFLNGGLGFYYFFQDYLSSGNSIFNFLINLPREYTNIQQNGYWWINVYLAYFLPQRGFLFAFPITLTVLILLYLGWQKSNKKFFILAGFLAGILPLVQAHSLFVIFLISLFFLSSPLGLNLLQETSLFYVFSPLL